VPDSYDYAQIKAVKLYDRARFEKTAELTSIGACDLEGPWIEFAARVVTCGYRFRGTTDSKEEVQEEEELIDIDSDEEEDDGEEEDDDEINDDWLGRALGEWHLTDVHALIRSYPSSIRSHPSFTPPL
jgi:hypothetical protein